MRERRTDGVAVAFAVAIWLLFPTSQAPRLLRPDDVQRLPFAPPDAEIA